MLSDPDANPEPLVVGWSPESGQIEFGSPRFAVSARNGLTVMTDLQVTVRAPGLMLQAPVAFSKEYPMDWGNLPRFWQELGQNWRGWPGTKSFVSSCNLELRATHDRLGTVEMRVSLESDPSWTGHVLIPLAAGELEDIAKKAERFFRVLQGAPE